MPQNFTPATAEEQSEARLKSRGKDVATSEVQQQQKMFKAVCSGATCNLQRHLLCVNYCVAHQSLSVLWDKSCLAVLLFAFLLGPLTQREKRPVCLTYSFVFSDNRLLSRAAGAALCRATLIHKSLK